jgi:hypothetical protein
MGYKVLCDRDVKWQPRKGLEGPFFYANGRVLYYDVKEGQYYDPTTDYYVEQDEMDQIHRQLAEILAK